MGYVHPHFSQHHRHEARASIQVGGVEEYGDSKNDAMAKAQVLALRVLAERLESNETGPQAITFSIAA
jgi:hypothetical protein